MSEETKSNTVTSVQWDTICFIEEFWHANKAFPSLEEIKNNVRFLTSVDDVEDVIFAPHIRKRLLNRGIDYSAVLRPDDEEYVLANKQTRLSDKQFAAINLLLNPFDQRTPAKKLAELGISQSTFSGWMKSAKFSTYYRDRSEELFSDGIPIAHAALMDKVANGDMKAIKLFYEVSGRYTGVDKTETVNLKMVVVKLLEIIQKHCSPDVITAINYDISILLGENTASVPNNRMITNSNISD